MFGSTLTQASGTTELACALSTQTFDNAGLIALAGGELLLGTGNFENTGTISLAGGAQVLDEGSLILNTGSIVGAGTFTAGIEFLQGTGQIEAKGGLLKIASATVENTVALLVDAGATLVVTGAFTGTATYNGANAALQLNQFTGFTGSTLAGAAATDTLTLASADATGVLLSHGTLTVDLSGGAVDKFAVTGNVLGATITKASASGSTITFNDSGTATWTHAGSGPWTTAADWSDGVVPTASPAARSMRCRRCPARSRTPLPLPPARASPSMRSRWHPPPNWTLSARWILSGPNDALGVAGSAIIAGVLANGTIGTNGTGTVSIKSGATLDNVTWVGPLTLAANTNVNVVDELQLQATGSIEAFPQLNMTAGGVTLEARATTLLSDMAIVTGGTTGTTGTIINDAAAGGTLSLGADCSLQQGAGGSTDFVSLLPSNAIDDPAPSLLAAAQ